MNFEQSKMHEALALAQTAYDAGEVPVGAVLVKQGSTVQRARNAMKALGNPLGHAELIVIQDYLRLNQGAGRASYLSDCDLYVTLEPCAMCAGAIAAARVRRVYFGAYDPKSGGTDHGARVFDHPQCHWKPEVFGGILEQECRQLLQDFFTQKR